jgi:hypothetical protein
VEADNAPHLLSKYHDVGSAESSKADYKPLHHAGHGNQYRADTINTFATVPACISRSPRLARQAQFCNRTLSLLSTPVEDYHGFAH